MPQTDRDRLAARVNSEYENFGYAEIFYGDTDAVAAVEADVVGNSLSADASAASALLDVTQTEFDKRATKNSGQAISQAIAAVNDRVVGRRPNDTRIWSMVRSTPIWSWGPTGILEEIAIDTLAWAFNPTTLAPLGLIFAGAATNVFTNPRLENAAVGFPGTPPTGVQAIFGGVGLTIETQAVGIVRNGMTGVRYRVNGVLASGSNAMIISFAPTNNGWTPAAVGESWSCSAFVSASLLTGISSTLLRLTFRNGGSDAGTFDTPSFLGSLSGGALYQASNKAVAPTLTSGVMHQLFFNAPAGSTVDAIVEIYAPQMKKLPFVDSPNFPAVASPAAATRAQGNVSIPLVNFGGRFNPRQGTLIVSWSSQSGAFTSSADTNFFGIISLGDLGANDVMGLLINPAHTAALFRRTVGGVVQSSSTLTITAPTAGQSVKFAMAWNADAGLMQVAARGAAGTKLTGQINIPIMTHLMPGRFSTTRPLFGQIDGVELWPLAVFDSVLAAKT